MPISLLKLGDNYERVTFAKSNNSANVPNMSLARSLMVTSNTSLSLRLMVTSNVSLARSLTVTSNTSLSLRLMVTS